MVSAPQIALNSPNFLAISFGAEIAQLFKNIARNSRRGLRAIRASDACATKSKKKPASMPAPSGDFRAPREYEKVTWWQKAFIHICRHPTMATGLRIHVAEGPGPLQLPEKFAATRTMCSFLHRLDDRLPARALVPRIAAARSAAVAYR